MANPVKLKFGLMIAVGLIVVLTACGNQEAAATEPGASGTSVGNESQSGNAHHGNADTGDKSENNGTTVSDKTGSEGNPAANSPATSTAPPSAADKPQQDAAGGTAPGSSQATPKPAEPPKEKPQQQLQPSSGGSAGTDKQTGQQQERQTAKTYTVEIKNFAFAPQELTVSVGSKLVFTNKDKAVHTATVDGAFDSGDLKQDESYTVELDKAGEYDVYCKPHPFMKMKLIVQ